MSSTCNDFQTIVYKFPGQLYVEWKSWSPWGLSSIESPASPIPSTLTPNNSVNYFNTAAAESSRVVWGSLGIYVRFRTHWPSSTSLYVSDRERTINIVPTGLEARHPPCGDMPLKAETQGTESQKLLNQLRPLRWEIGTNSKHAHNLRSVRNNILSL